MELKMRLLGSLESHRKLTLKAIYQIYPHENKVAIIRALFQLKDSGWVKLNKQVTIDGYILPWPTAYRTKKEMYEHQTIPFID